MNMPQRSYDEVIAEREQYPFGKPRPYSPNHPNLLTEGLITRRAEYVPLVSGIWRVLLVLIALLALAYGIHGVVTDDLYLPGKRSPGTHYQGMAAWLIFGMILSFSSALIAWAFAKMDTLQHKVDNQFLLTCLCVSAILFMLAGIAVHVSVS